MKTMHINTVKFDGGSITTLDDLTVIGNDLMEFDGGWVKVRSMTTEEAAVADKLNADFNARFPWQTRPNNAHLSITF